MKLVVKLKTINVVVIKKNVNYDDVIIEFVLCNTRL